MSVVQGSGRQPGPLCPQWPYRGRGHLRAPNVAPEASLSEQAGGDAGTQKPGSRRTTSRSPWAQAEADSGGPVPREQLLLSPADTWLGGRACPGGRVLDHLLGRSARTVQDTWGLQEEQLPLGPAQQPCRTDGLGSGRWGTPGQGAAHRVSKAPLAGLVLTAGAPSAAPPTAHMTRVLLALLLFGGNISTQAPLPHAGLSQKSGSCLIPTGPSWHTDPSPKPFPPPKLHCLGHRICDQRHRWAVVRLSYGFHCFQSVCLDIWTQWVSSRLQDLRPPLHLSG